MLTILNWARPLRLIQYSIVRSSATNGTISDRNFPSRPLKQSFPNEKFKERVDFEVKQSQQRILTVPNILTMSRIASTPIIGYFLWNGMTSPALACFAFAATTDLLDGFIARKFKQSSDIGAILDPVADKLLLMTCFVSMCHAGLMPYWLVKGFFVRDSILLLGGTAIRYYSFDERPSLKKFIDLKNYPTLGFEPTFVSKCNTALQCLLVVIHLTANHLVGMPLYDWSLFALQCTTTVTATHSLIEYAIRFGYTTNIAKRFRRLD